MKYIKKIMVVTMSALMSGSFIIPAFAEETSGSSKEEVIYVMSDASGKITDMEAVNIFAGGNITDYGDYSSVKMLNTTDSITQNGDKITFSSDADKVYYQGTMKEKNLPWNISIRYFLDGKEYSAKDIAGKSGALEIRFSVSKNEACQDSFYEDYALQAAFTLDTEKCENIRATGATAANAGSKKQLTYTILPGRGIDTVIQSDVTDFQMDAVSINGIRLNLNFTVDDEALTEKVDGIISAVGTVNDGAAEVNSGVGQLADASGTLSSGLSAIKDKNSQLTGAAYTAYEGLCTAATTALNSQLASEGMDTVSLTPSTYSDVLSGLLKKLNADSVYNEAYQTALNKVTKQVEAQADTLYRGYIESQADSVYRTYLSSQADVLYTQTATQAVCEQLKQNGYSEQQANVYLQSGEGQALVAQTLTDMTDEQKEQIISKAIAQLSDEQKEQILQEALDSLSKEQKTQIQQGYIQQMMTCEEVTAQINAAVATVSDAAKQVSQLKGQLDSYSVFYQGLVSYTDAVSSAASGAAEIKLNMDKLYAGSTQLADGTSEFADKTSGIDTQINDEVKDMVSSVSRSDAKIVSFLSDKNTDVTSVQFVIKTAAIEKAEAEVTKTAASDSLTFWQKLLRLFGENGSYTSVILFSE